MSSLLASEATLVSGGKVEEKIKGGITHWFSVGLHASKICNKALNKCKTLCHGESAALLAKKGLTRQLYPGVEISL